MVVRVEASEDLELRIYLSMFVAQLYLCFQYENRYFLRYDQYTRIYPLE